MYIRMFCTRDGQSDWDDREDKVSLSFLPPFQPDGDGEPQIGQGDHRNPEMEGRVVQEPTIGNHGGLLSVLFGNGDHDKIRV